MLLEVDGDRAGRATAAGGRWSCSVLGAAAALAGAAVPAHADRQIVFQDLRTLIAVTVEERADRLLVDFGHGNRAELPRAAVLEIRDYTPPPPAPPAGGAAPFCGPPTPTWRDHAGAHAEAVAVAAARHNLSPALVTAVARAESRFDALALSPKGAQGVMQLMPATVSRLRVSNVWDAEENIEAGARWLRRLLSLFDENLDLALAAYNAGEEAVRRYNGVPPYPETLDYIEKVRQALEQYGAAEGDDLSA